MMPEVLESVSNIVAGVGAAADDGPGALAGVIAGVVAVAVAAIPLFGGANM